MNQIVKTPVKHDFLSRLGISQVNSGVSNGITPIESSGKIISSHSPVDGEPIASVKVATPLEYEEIIQKATSAFNQWKMVPAPKRGEIVRQIGLRLREFKSDLGSLISYEMGKTYQEGLGEVQEMIDVADFAVGLSRQLYGLTMHSEREYHRMYEQYHPLGVTGVVTAFNFPVAVWAWNAMIALVCGNTVVWKPSSKVMLCAIAVHNIIEKTLKENHVIEGVVNLVAGNSDSIGDLMLNDKRIPLVSVTGSTKVGRHVNRIVGDRLGKTILELGGNNAIIISQHSNQQLALMASLFGAVATSGQRCTTTRRLIIQEEIYNSFIQKLIQAYQQLKIGNPLDPQTIVGPLVDQDAVKQFVNAQEKIIEEGGNILYGGSVLNGEGFESGCYVVPCIAEVTNDFKIVKEETFAPILYLIKYKTIEQAVAINNDVPQGLSSAIFSENLRETEYFLSHKGSDCGIANVNIATNGAEIGGAFGGEKDTGGGRESGSDSWKAYMRRQTNTINYSLELPLAQGINFNVPHDKVDNSNDIEAFQ
ncbi:MAG TPA: aldehyde dehydrogenase family protein [Lentimicrobium sp.]|nr:aldehyde dehydrogenase family protein [Lentimicrobium sp.]